MWLISNNGHDTRLTGISEILAADYFWYNLYGYRIHPIPYPIIVRWNKEYIFNNFRICIILNVRHTCRWGTVNHVIRTEILRNMGTVRRWRNRNLWHWFYFHFDKLHGVAISLPCLPVNPISERPVRSAYVVDSIQIGIMTPFVPPCSLEYTCAIGIRIIVDVVISRSKFLSVLPTQRISCSSRVPDNTQIEIFRRTPNIESPEKVKECNLLSPRIFITARYIMSSLLKTVRIFKWVFGNDIVPIHVPSLEQEPRLRSSRTSFEILKYWLIIVEQ